MEEAVHRLYRACKSTNSFPGTMENDHSDHVTTLDIFRGLGLVTDPAPPGFVAALGTKGRSQCVQSSASFPLIDDGPNLDTRPSHIDTRTSPSYTRITTSISTSTQSRETAMYEATDPAVNSQRRVASETPRNMREQFEHLTNPPQSFISPDQRDSAPLTLPNQIHQQPDVQSQHTSFPTLSTSMNAISVIPLWYHLDNVTPSMHTIPSPTIPRYETDESWGSCYQHEQPRY